MATQLKTLGLGFAVVVGLVSFGVQSASAGNPIIGGNSHVGSYYDPFNDHVYVDVHNLHVRQSYLDWNRNYIDPGSYRYVDRYYYDVYGRLIHEFGPTWTSFGKPHGKLTREFCQSYPNTTVHGSDTVLYNQVPGNNYPSYPGSFPGTTVHQSDTVLYMKVPPKK